MRREPDPVGRWARAWPAASFGTFVAAALLVSPGIAEAEEADPADWPEYHRTGKAWRYSPLDQIDRDNVGELRVAWIHQAGDITHGRQETPIVVDGVIYSTAAYNVVFAIDGTTGKEIWRYEPRLHPLVDRILFTPYSRGVTVGTDKVFIGTLDGRGIALDRETGEELWQVQLTDFENCHGCNFTSPPVLAGEVLTFGSIGGDLWTSGKIYGVDADTGEQIWAFETISKDPADYPGESWKYGGGGAWLPGTYDPETDTVYYGTSNPAPDYYGENRKGTNLYTSSLIALDPKTGELKWYHQEIPHDVWDFDSAYEALEVEHDGKKLLVHLNKSGFVFVYDKSDGGLHNVWPLISSYNFAETIDPESGEIIGRVDPKPGEKTLVCPSLQGARSWNHGAYSPTTGLWYTNAMELCMTIMPVEEEVDPKAFMVPAFGTKGFELYKVDGVAPGRLDARDPVTGDLKWSVEFPLPSWGSVLATAGGLVVNGDPLGMLRAFDADTGAELWSFNTGSGLRSGLVSYAADGRQYILVPSGWGSWASVLFPAMFPELGSVNGAASLIAFTVD